MKKIKLNAQGFTHTFVLLAVITVVIIGSVFVTVLNAHKSPNTKANVVTASKNGRKTTISSNERSQSGLSTASPANTSQNGSVAKSSVATSVNKSGVSAPSQSKAAPSPAPAPTPSQTPLSVLTSLISALDNGSQLNVTASSVSVPGPITSAQARPIVFTANGQVYFAYTQGHAPNFTTSAAQTAGTMAIVNATVSNPPLVQAHLDKAANLVDPNSSGYLVGYSVGGN